MKTDIKDQNKTFKIQGTKLKLKLSIKDQMLNQA
jgi:hypothetical protein